MPFLPPYLHCALILKLLEFTLKLALLIYFNVPLIGILLKVWAGCALNDVS